MVESDKSITWVIYIFRDEIKKILLDNPYNPVDVNDAHVKSEGEEKKYL